MNVFDAISKIRIVRKFQKKDVDDNIVGLLLHSATHALSAGNLQEWEFIVVKDEDVKKKLASAALKLEHVYTAPIDIVVCADIAKAALKYGKRGEVVYAVEDAAQAAILLIVAANALGLGTDLVRAFDEEEIKGILNLPDNIRPIAIIPIGYPAEEGEVNIKIPFENITHVNRYGNKIEIEFTPIREQLESVLKHLRKLAK
jgi:nitroreductase